MYFDTPPHQSVKRAEVDEGVDDVGQVPASSCLAQVPTNNSKATQLTAQHALMQDAQMHEFSISAAVRDERKVWRIVQKYTHTSKLAKPLNMQWCS